MLKQIFNGILGFALPSTCLACEVVLDKGTRFICPDCRLKLIKFEDSHPWKEEEISRGVINDSFSLYQFREGTPIQSLLHSLKYEKFKSVGRMFGREIGEKILTSIDAKFDYVVPVPLHRSKQRERTFNQSLFICKGISDILQINVLDKCMKRTRFTKTQTKLDKLSRHENVHGAFEINPKFKKFIQRKNIILTDDVITTGATILECARVIKANGCAGLLICSAAYAVLD